MQILTSKRAMAVFISLVLIFGLGVTISMAQQKIKTAGKATYRTTDQQMFDVGDTENHFILISSFEGTNVSTGKHKFLDGAQVVGTSYAEVVDGNGYAQGSVNMSLNGDAVFSEYEGQVITTLSPEGNPIATIRGTFRWIKGTGQFENIHGEGTYKGESISSTEGITEWEAEWEGEYFIGDKKE